MLLVISPKSPPWYPQFTVALPSCNIQFLRIGGGGDGWGEKKLKYFKKGDVRPPTPRKIFQLKKKLVYNGLSRAWLNSGLNVKLWRLFSKFTLSSVWWKLLPNVKNERVYHTISGLKCGFRRTPPHFFWKPKKTCGGVYFMWSGELFLRIFLSYPQKKNIPGLKGGIF